MGQRSVDHKSKRYAAHSPNVASSEMHCSLGSLCYCRCSSLFLLPASSRVAAINFHTQTTQLQLVLLATCRARLPHVTAAVAAAARCKRANKLRIDLCDLWHSRKINLNKRSVLVSTLSSLSCSAHLPLPLPPGKCKFYMKIKEYKTEAATKVWREVACGMWQVASDAVRFASVLAMFAWRIT